MTPDPTLRLTRLLCHTTGEAHQAISGVDLGDAECYTRAMAILKENFGSKYVVGASIMRNLKHGPIATTPKDIRNLATELQNAETCLKRHNMYGELNKAAKLFKQHKRLLTNSYHKLCRYIAERSVEPFESHRTDKLRRDEMGLMEFTQNCNTK